MGGTQGEKVTVNDKIFRIQVRTKINGLLTDQSAYQQLCPLLKDKCKALGCMWYAIRSSENTGMCTIGLIGDVLIAEEEPENVCPSSDYRY